MDAERTSGTGNCLANMNNGTSRATFFGSVKEHQVTFCIDTSDSMYGCLDTVKEHLIELLERRAMLASEEDAFNLIEFSTGVVQWSDKLVAWTPQTVSLAARWVRNLAPKTGTNTRDALITALSDASCEAVYLVTDSIPDQHVSDVVDAALRVAGNRPIHCFYIHSEEPDPSAVSFLKELAAETFGSLHIVIVAHHGAVESVTPVYTAENMGFVRSTARNVFPPAFKHCSVATTLDGPPQVAAIAPPVIPYGVPYCAPSVPVPCIPPYPYCLYPWPYRYYYSFIPPYSTSWTRYRPAKAWLKHTQDFIDQALSIPVPGAGAMLIGARVLARRHADGLFYLGTVKSQILNNQFLVEFGPCKHGKYTDTAYQETYVYDIVSHADALRHPILHGDRVLAPWEPEGERYAPGVVIDGQERRMADGGEPDKPLVVTFQNGKTVAVPKDRAMWIPHELHERVTFEIGLPEGVRKDLARKDCYPDYSINGYPGSGSLAFPAQFPQHVPADWIDTKNRPVGWGGGSCQGYPWMTRPSSTSSLVLGTRHSEVDERIPGTRMTKTELNQKVAQQIQRNSGLLTDEYSTTNRPSLENGTLRKSVSFADMRDLEAGSSKDSGNGSQGDLNTSDQDMDADQGFVSDSEGRRTRDVAVGTNAVQSPFSSRRTRSKSAKHHKDWKYWKSDPAPSLLEPMHYGQYREGPFRDSIGCPSVLLRDANRTSCNTVEWTSPMTKVVDPFAQYRYYPTVKDCLLQPRPPSYKPAKQGPAKDFSERLGSAQLEQEMLAEARRNYRQNQVLAREIGWQRHVADTELSAQNRLDYHRQKTVAQIDRERSRVEDQFRDAEQRRLTKQQQAQGVIQRQQETLNNRVDKEARRIAALSVNRVKREVDNLQRQEELQHTYANRQATRELESAARREANIARVSELECQAAAQYRQKTQVQASRAERDRRVALDEEKRKQLSAQVNEQKKAILRSQIFC